MLDVIAGKRDHIKIFGTDYNTIDGTCIRDYVHVSDLIDAHIKGLESIKNGGKNRVYNLGTGQGFSVREVIRCAQQITNKTIKIEECGRRSGDCAKLVSSSFLVKEELEWYPLRSNLNQMIEDAWRWHKAGSYSR